MMLLGEEGLHTQSKCASPALVIMAMAVTSWQAGQAVEAAQVQPVYLRDKVAVAQVG